MTTIKLVLDDLTLIFTFTTVGGKQGYSGSYAVLMGNEQHVMRCGTRSSNSGDGPSHDSLMETLEDVKMGLEMELI